MKTQALLFILTLTGLNAFTQNSKCLDISNTIITNVKATIQSQSVDSDDTYFIKAEFPQKYDLETLKTICDTTAKAVKVSQNWTLNYDKNHEKEFIINGKKLLVTIYFNDKFLYFEFPNE
jgi:hypothetical protein